MREREREKEKEKEKERVTVAVLGWCTPASKLLSLGSIGFSFKPNTKERLFGFA